MKYELIETNQNNNEITFDFNGFDDCDDFVKIMNIIKGVIKPKICKYSGLTDMDGYFEKDGLRVVAEYNSMIGNYLIFNGDKTEVNIAKVRRWAKLIFDNLMLSAGEN